MRLVHPDRWITAGGGRGARGGRGRADPAALDDRQHQRGAPPGGHGGGRRGPGPPPGRGARRRVAPPSASTCSTPSRTSHCGSAPATTSRPRSCCSWSAWPSASSRCAAAARGRWSAQERQDLASIQGLGALVANGEDADYVLLATVIGAHPPPRPRRLPVRGRSRPTTGAAGDPPRRKRALGAHAVGFRALGPAHGRRRHPRLVPRRPARAVRAHRAGRPPMSRRPAGQGRRPRRPSGASLARSGAA